MRWTRGERSQDIEDRRGESPSGGGMGFRVGGGIGLGGALILLVLSLVFGQNFFALLDGGGDVSSGARRRHGLGAAAEGGTGGGAARRLRVVRARRRAEHVDPRVPAHGA